MLGFGRPANEKAVIGLFEPTFLALGFSPEQAKESATSLFDNVKKELLADSPALDLYKRTQGSICASDANYMAPRLKAGLTIQDVRSFWNRPYIVVMCETQFRDMIAFMAIDTARQQGQDVGEAIEKYNRTTVRYGDPAKWNSQSPNNGLRDCDAPIYLEFATRVEAWTSKTPVTEIDRLVNKYGTFNALVRQLVSNGLLR